MHFKSCNVYVIDLLQSIEINSSSITGIEYSLRQSGHSIVALKSNAFTSSMDTLTGVNHGIYRTLTLISYIKTRWHEKNGFE